MKILVCGGREYNNRDHIYAELDGLTTVGDITHLIHGNSTGADLIAHEWARSRGVQPVACAANWTWFRALGRPKAAGPARNKAMLALGPDLVVAFPGGRGTESMIGLAREAGIPVELL